MKLQITSYDMDMDSRKGKDNGLPSTTNKVSAMHHLSVSVFVCLSTRWLNVLLWLHAFEDVVTSFPEH